MSLYVRLHTQHPGAGGKSEHRAPQVRYASEARKRRPASWPTVPAAAQVDGGDGMVGGAGAGATGTSSEQVRPADY